MAKVLVVDDASEIRTLLKRFLEKAGHEVWLASSADDAMTELRRGGIDLVLLDLEMPVKDGAACLQMIRRDPQRSNQPVVMVTATPKREVVMRVVELGVQGIVIKKDNWVPNLIKTVAKLTGPDMIIPARPAQAPMAGVARPSTATVSSAPLAAPTSVRPASALTSVTPGGPRDHAPPEAGHRASKPTGDPAAPADPASRASAVRAGVPIALAVGAWSPPVIPDVEEPMTADRAMEVLKSLKPIIARSELMETMLAETVSVRALKPAAQQVLQLTQRSETSVVTIANAIRQDQALSVRILKVANSTLYARGDIVDTVLKAVARIGLEQIRTAVLSIAVLDAFGSVSPNGVFRPDWFWEHGTACGLLAMRLAQAAGSSRDHCDTMFTAGLLHDLGRLLFAEQLGELYPKVIETADRLELPLETVETRLLLLNHADITDRLLRHWKFPPSLISPVAMHHLSVGNIKATAPRQADDVIPLALANRLAHAMVLGSSGNEVVYAIEDFIEHLRLEDRVVEELCRTSVLEIADLRINMLMHADDPGQGYRDSVRDRLGDVRALSLAIQPAIDPVALLLRALSANAQPESANVVTLRVKAPTERAAILNLLAEAAARCPTSRTLPVLVVGNGKSCLFRDGMLGNRQVCQVTLPIGVNRLFRHLRTLAGVDAGSRLAA